jgi:hypothetical protein
MIRFDTKLFDHEPLPVDLSSLAESESIHILKENIYTGSGKATAGIVEADALSPGFLSPMPHGNDSQWISSAGIIGGKLHIQIATVFTMDFGPSFTPQLFLETKDSEYIEADYSIGLICDGNYKIFSMYREAYDGAEIRLEDYVFSVDLNELADMKLCFYGSVSSGVRGQWSVTAPLSDTSKQIRVFDKQASVNGYDFDHFTLSPLGLEATGFLGEKADERLLGLATGVLGEDEWLAMEAKAETPYGLVFLGKGGSSFNHQDKSFSISWRTDETLDVASVTALIIGEVRIPIYDNQN